MPKYKHIACTAAAVIAGMSYSYFMHLRNKGKGPPETITNDGKIVFVRPDVVAWKKAAPWRSYIQGQNPKRVPSSDMVRFDLYVSKEWLQKAHKLYGPNLSAKFRPALLERFPT